MVYRISHKQQRLIRVRLEGKQKRTDLKVIKGHVLSPVMLVVPAVYLHDDITAMEKILSNKLVLTHEHSALTSF